MSSSKRNLILALCGWALALLGLSRLLAQQPVLRLAIEAVLTAAMAVYWARFEGWGRFAKLIVPNLLIVAASITIAGRILDASYGPFLGSLYALLTLLAGALLYQLYLYLIGVHPSDDFSAAAGSLEKTEK